MNSLKITVSVFIIAFIVSSMPNYIRFNFLIYVLNSGIIYINNPLKKKLYHVLLQ